MGKLWQSARRTNGAGSEAPARELARQRFFIYGVPWVVRLAVLALALFVLLPLLHAWFLGSEPADLGESLRLLVLSVLLPALAAAAWQQRRHDRLASRPEYEPALNDRAVAWLRAHDDFDRVKLDSEVPRETVYLPGWRARWLLVTNRRILLFVASARERQLVSEWPRRAVVFAGPPELAPGGRQRSLWSWLVRAPNLVLAFTTGTTLRLHCASGATARRVAELLMASPAILEGEAVAPRATKAHAPRRRWHEVLASLLVPGTGQWLQGRFVTGAVLFTAAVLLAIYDWAPVLWALHGPRMEVSALSVVSAVFTWLLLVLLASSDAWQFSATRRRR
jgi:hypothetical protein